MLLAWRSYTINSLGNTYVGHLLRAATANFLARFSLGCLWGAATAYFQPSVSVGRWVGAANTNFQQAFPWAASRPQVRQILFEVAVGSLQAAIKRSKCAVSSKRLCGQGAAAANFRQGSLGASFRSQLLSMLLGPVLGLGTHFRGSQQCRLETMCVFDWWWRHMALM